MQTTINVTSDSISISGPYSEDNNRVWKNMGGKYSNGSWTLPDTDTTRAKLAELFGSKSDEVDALVPSDKISRSYGSIEQIGGYVLASRRGRDYSVQMPAGVSLAAGSFAARGGSVKNPSVRLDSTMVFRLRCRHSFAEANGLEIATATTVFAIEI